MGRKYDPMQYQAYREHINDSSAFNTAIIKI